MKAPLNDFEAWENIKHLLGENNCSLKRGIQRRTVDVTEDAVIFEGGLKIPKEQILRLYNQVYRESEVMADEASIWTYARAHSILVQAFPNDLEAVPGKNLGIRLKKKYFPEH